MLVSPSTYLIIKLLSAKVSSILYTDDKFMDMPCSFSFKKISSAVKGWFSISKTSKSEFLCFVTFKPFFFSAVIKSVLFANLNPPNFYIIITNYLYYINFFFKIKVMKNTTEETKTIVAPVTVFK